MLFRSNIDLAIAFTDDDHPRLAACIEAKTDEAFSDEVEGVSLCFLFATGFGDPALLEFSRSGRDWPPRWWPVGGFRRNRQAVPAATSIALRGDA